MNKRTKKITFTALVFLLPFLLLVLAESALRVTGFAAERRAAFKPVQNEPGWMGFNPEYPGRYFRGFLPALGFTPFRREASARTFRVVVLGGSSTAGFPYQWYHGFPTALEKRLMATMPGRDVEVVNLGMTAVNSYTLWDVTRHVVSMQPDAVVIYAGHNEYYGALGAGATPDFTPKGVWFGRLQLLLKRSVLYLALEQLIVGPPDYGLDPAANERTLMARVVQNAGIEQGDRVYRAGLRQFERNMQDVVARLRDHAIPVFLGTLVSNLADQAPLSDAPRALAAYESAQRALSRGDTLRARALFVEARDLDTIRFRAPSAVNDIIRSLASGPGVTLVNMEQVFDRAARNAIPGNDLFTDHLHPTVLGYDLMGEAFHRALRREMNGRQDTLTILWPHPPEIDPLSRAQAGILINRLLSDYPFNKNVNPDEAGSKHAEQLRIRRSTGALGDSLAVQIMTSPLSTQEALYEAVRISEERSDTLAALQHFQSLLHWQPFNAALMRDAVDLALNSPTWDPQVEKLALHGAGRTDDAYFWNALAVTQLRQGRPRSALRALREAERIEPASGVLFYNRARARLAVGDTLGAQQDFNAYRRQPQ